MKAVIQRVKHASVTVDEVKIADIKQGVLLLLGVADKILKKILFGCQKKLRTLEFLMMKMG